MSRFCPEIFRQVTFLLALEEMPRQVLSARRQVIDLDHRRFPFRRDSRQREAGYGHSTHGGAAIIDSGLNQADVHFSLQYIIKGLVILGAVWIDVRRRK